MGKVKYVELSYMLTKMSNLFPKCRRVPFHIRKDVEKELKRLEDQDVIEKVSCPWDSPIVVVPKTNSRVRVCIDMREANKAISRERYPMPTVDDLINDLNSSAVQKMYLASLICLMHITSWSRFITPFVKHICLHIYKSLSFGVNADPEIFQEVITDMLADIPDARNLSDDIIIHGKSQADYDKALRRSLQRLQNNGVRLNKDKCIFSVTKFTFFGHVFSHKGVSADPEKVKTIVGHAAPMTPSEVRSFLGMTQYVSRYILHYGTITEPLRRLTKQHTPWSYASNEEKAFDCLKDFLASASVMVYFDQTKPIVMWLWPNWVN